MLLKALLNFLLQPLFWLTLLAVIFSYFKRIKQQRQHFRIAIDPDFYEGRHLLKNGFWFTLIGAVIMLGLGVMLPPSWIGIYQIILLFTVIGFVVFNSDSSWLWLLSVAAFAFASYFGQTFPVLFINQTETPNWSTFLRSSPSLMIVGALLAGFKLLMLRRFDLLTALPTIKTGKRGRRLVKYSWQELSLIPLFCLIPGDSLQHLLPNWPFLTISGHSFTFFVLPVVVTSGISYWRRAAQEVLQFKKNELTKMIFAFCLTAAISYFIPLLVPVMWLTVLLVFLVNAVLSYRFSRQGSNWYFDTYTGVRIIAVQPQTPAARMGLKPGDVILTCNGLAVHNEDELYQALQQEPTFCRLKLRTYVGRLKLAQSAIFANAPHEIGLIIFH